MKLQVPFVQLPLRFDAERMAAEVGALEDAVWLPHPTGFAGNSALSLISVGGDPLNEEVMGEMRPTPWLDACPYLMQTLDSLGAVWGRSRLMRLSGNAEVSPHVDLNYYWRERVRVHVPILTQPTVRFLCDDAEVNMAAGECWIFDTWRRHCVYNDATRERIHLVADTVGGERFFDLVARGRTPGRSSLGWQAKRIEPSAAEVPRLRCEATNAPVVMTPWELREHLNFLLGEAAPHPQLAAAAEVCGRFGLVWQALWANHGEAESGWPEYRAALDGFAQMLERAANQVMLRNGSVYLKAVNAIVLHAALADRKRELGGRETRDAAASASAQGPDAGGEFDRPVFVVSSPRSGSSLLFETLAQAPDLYTLGGENHVQFEAIEMLRPAARGYDSNRLEADDATPEVAARLRRSFHDALRDRERTRPGRGPVRMLEKTPKNSLRIPFLARAFPDARFVYLYRDPRQVLSSMIEAWTSGRYRTYPGLPGWQGPEWSLLLVPGWRELAGRSVAEIVAAQWETTTRLLLDDLAKLPAERIVRVRYDRFLADPQVEMQRLAEALALRWDVELDHDLPLSRHTISRPDADKWRRHEADIEAVWPSIAETAERAAAFADAP